MVMKDLSAFVAKHSHGCSLNRVGRKSNEFSKVIKKLRVSALGQKRTYAVQNVMSALHPKADMCGATRDVRFGPIADIGEVDFPCADHSALSASSEVELTSGTVRQY